MSIESPLQNWPEVRKAVCERDLRQCTNCRSSIEAPDQYDVDHNVPSGAGGSSRLANLNALCRQCHDAKHGNGIAPTVQIQSTGQMTDEEFMWFNHLCQDMVPALAEAVGVWMEEPEFGIKNVDAYFLPLGDLRRVSQALDDAEVEYQSLQAAQFM